MILLMIRNDLNDDLNWFEMRFMNNDDAFDDLIHDLKRFDWWFEMNWWMIFLKGILRSRLRK